MHVDNLLIIGFCAGTNKAEIYKGLEALYGRAETQGTIKRICVVYVTQNPDGVPGGSLQPLYLDSDASTVQKVKKCLHYDFRSENFAASPVTKGTNGVYLMCHGTADKFILENAFFPSSAQNATGVADLVEALATTCGMTKLEKLSVITCNGAVWGDNSPVALMSRRLAASTVKPKTISGWTCAVFVNAHGKKSLSSDPATNLNRDKAQLRQAKVYLRLSSLGAYGGFEAWAPKAVQLDDGGLSDDSSEDERLLGRLDLAGDQGCCAGCTLF